VEAERAVNQGGEDVRQKLNYNVDHSLNSTRSPSDMLDNLTNRLARVMKTLKGEARLTESNIADALREVRMALLEADVALPVVKEFIAAVKEKAVGEEVIGSLSPGQALIGVVHAELTKIMGAAHEGINFNTQPPAIVLMAGLQGAGKTTTVGKLGKFLKENHKKKVLVVSCDVYRPAAIEQLKSVAGQAGVDFFPSAVGEKPEAIATAAIDWAKRHYHDVLLVDTAGRLAIDEEMMAEIKRLHAAINPIETLFVVDAMLGQDAVNTAKAFNEALPLTGVVLTKLDGDARGGAALVGASHHRQADQVRRRRRKADWSRSLPSRADGLAHSGHGRRPVADRGGAQGAGRGKGRRLRQETEVRQGLRPQRLQGPDGPDAQHGRPVGADGQNAGADCPGWPVSCRRAPRTRWLAASRASSIR
jgi:signal recognition particle GTPase